MKSIYHKREVRVIYSLTTERKSVINGQQIICKQVSFFDSNTQETTKRQVCSLDVSRFPPLYKKKSRQELRL